MHDRLMMRKMDWTDQCQATDAGRAASKCNVQNSKRTATESMKRNKLNQQNKGQRQGVGKIQQKENMEYLAGDEDHVTLNTTPKREHAVIKG